MCAQKTKYETEPEEYVDIEQEAAVVPVEVCKLLDGVCPKTEPEEYVDIEQEGSPCGGTDLIMLINQLLGSIGGVELLAGARGGFNSRVSPLRFQSIGYLLLPSLDMAERWRKRRKSSKQPTNYISFCLQCKGYRMVKDDKKGEVLQNCVKLYLLRQIISAVEYLRHVQ